MILPEEIKKHVNILYALATTFESEDAKQQMERHLTLSLAVILNNPEMINALLELHKNA